VTLKAVILSCKYPIFGAVYTIVSGIAAGKPCAEMVSGFWFPVWMLLIAGFAGFRKRSIEIRASAENNENNLSALSNILI
jgi:hypothetical protein